MPLTSPLFEILSRLLNRRIAELSQSTSTDHNVPIQGLMAQSDSVLPQHIFREYDIRGLVGSELDEQLFEQVGRAYGAALRVLKDCPTAVLGHDNRPSSPSLAAALARGVASSGVDVIEIGTAPTPTLYWAERTLGADGGLQVTGSHNPPEYNGLKMTLLGRPLWGDQVRDLRRRIRARDLVLGQGQRREESVLDDYIADLTARFRVEGSLKVVVDCGNGVGSLVAVELLEAIGAEVIPLYCESDGTFPNHHPDPTVDENLVDLRKLVLETQADIGIAFDGDADRIGVVDDRGKVVRGDVLLLLLGLDLLERAGPGQKLIFDVKCSQVLPEVFEAMGGIPIMWKTGHSLMKEKMRDEQAPLAGELSGHIFFGEDYFGFDDALFAACRITQILSAPGPKISQRVDAFPVYLSTPEIRLDVDENRKFDLVASAVAHFKETHEVIEIDGARVLFDGGWALLRASNTQPAVVCRYEATTPERLEEIRATVGNWLRKNGVDPDA